MELRGNFWVLYNYIRADKRFHCNESITYTTHCDPTFLDNLEPLLERWQGPVSIGVYAPGSDYETTIRIIQFYRMCSKSLLVKTLATFHLFFDADHMPKDPILDQESFAQFKVNCDDDDPLKRQSESYKRLRDLDYPVNVARNIARETANTHFIFPSDIELYPSPGTINAFLDMIRRDPSLFRSTSKRPKVFVNAIFEIREGHNLPQNKRELVQMLDDQIVIPFHQHLCRNCHELPREADWKLDLESGKGLLKVNPFFL
jgi:beta-1,4-glucuronyltransferase 1